MYDLALALGVHDVDSMARQMSPGHVIEWMAYNRINPFTQERADWRAGMIAATMANIWRGKNQPAYQPGDFTPDFKRAVRKSPTELYQTLKAGMALGVGLIDKRGMNA